VDWRFEKRPKPACEETYSKPYMIVVLSTTKFSGFVLKFSAIFCSLFFSLQLFTFSLFSVADHHGLIDVEAHS
jgi:hypothetical protein